MPRANLPAAMALIEEAHKAAKLLLDQAYVRIATRVDADAACATALIAHALRRENIDFHVTWLDRLTDPAATALADENPDALVLVGLSGDASHADHGASRRVILDRVAATLEGEASLDASRSADTQADASIGSLAQLLAIAISRRNGDLAPLAVASALARRGIAGRLRGLDAEILAEALENDVIMRHPALALHGTSVLHALSQLDAPYVSGLTGRARNVKKLVQDLHVAGDATPGNVQGPDAERLGSYLAARLIEQDAPDAALDALFRPTYRALKGPLTGHDMGHLALRAEAACAQRQPSLAFAASWPDPTSVPEVAEAETNYRAEIVAALMRAERERRAEGPLVLVDAPSAPTTRGVADRVAASLAMPQRLVVARHADDARVTLALRAYGDAPHVGNALRHAVAAAGGVATGTRGEGHAMVDAAEEQRFLKALAEGFA